MVKVFVTDREGALSEIDAEEGTTIMEAVRDFGIADILALCGGSCACATCHVYVDNAWLEKTGEASEDEDEIMNSSIHRKSNSRLSCQISLRTDLDGIRVTVAPED